MQHTQKLRMTTQRQVILDELKKLKSHPTASELCEIVRRRLPRISLGTVYRNLEILSRTGHIQRLEVAGVEMRFDGDTSNHYHVRCAKCGAVADLEMNLSGELEMQADRLSDFQILGHRVEFTGLCPMCQDGAARH